MQNLTNKRPIWSYPEKKCLLQLCKDELRIIAIKSNDAGSRRLKNNAWERIHQNFSEAFGSARTCNRLKEEWKRMIACTRKDILDFNNGLERYGQEGSDLKEPSPFTLEMWEFMQQPLFQQCESGISTYIGNSETENDDENDNNNNGRTGAVVLNYIPARLESICITHFRKLRNNSTNNNNNNNGNNQQNGSVDQQVPPDDQQVPPSKKRRTSSNSSIIQHQIKPTTTSSSSPSSSSPSSSSPSSSPSSPSSSTEFQMFMEMERKEHLLRMQILEAQLITAQHYKKPKDC